jgi:hypothetical protein
MAIIEWRMCCDVKELNLAACDAGYTSSGTKALIEIMVLQYKTSPDLKVIVTSTTMLLQRSIHKYTFDFSWSEHTHSDRISTYRERHSGIPHIWYLGRSVALVTHCMVVANVTDRLTVSKRITQEFNMEKFDCEESKRCGNKRNVGLK